MTVSNEVLTISDVTFMVTSQIQRAPHWTMIRELTMNALEAAAQSSGEKTVHWTSGKYNGVRKAVIWNTGPGMDPAELKLATDLACKVNKNLGLDDNFGVGAKVSSLESNKRGMRFRSCKDGGVSEVILGYDDDEKAFVRFVRDLPNGASDTVIDVTAAAIKDGRPAEFDWTEVMLLGNYAEQDTTEKLFDSVMQIEKSYIANALYRRFYRIPDGVKLRLDAIYTRFDTTRNFKPIGGRYDSFERTETVGIPELGLKIHFLHDPSVGDRSGLRKSSRSALGSTTTTFALVYKDEMYSVMTGNEWSAAAPRFGIPFGSKELCVHVELDDELARPSQYRERLISRETGGDILPEDFVLYVRERMPAWVLEVIKNASPRATEDFTDIQKELQDLLNKWKVRVQGRRLDPAGSPSEEGAETAGEDLAGGGGSGTGNGTGSRRNTHRRIFEVPEGATTTTLYEVYERPPKITMLEDVEAVTEKGLHGRAAVFYQETGDLFVNGLYEAVDRTVAEIEPVFIGQTDDETVRRATTSVARHALALRVGKAVVFALAKRLRDDWNSDDLRAALSKESLTIAADNYEESLSAIKRQVTKNIKVLNVAAA